MLINGIFYFDSLSVFRLMQGNGDRAYLIETPGGSEEILLAVRVVTGLKKLNSEEKRQMQQYDKAFIKVLLVGFIGIQQIKERGINKDELKLIKSMLQILKKSHLVKGYSFYFQVYSQSA